MKTKTQRVTYATYTLSYIKELRSLTVGHTHICTFTFTHSFTYTEGGGLTPRDWAASGVLCPPGHSGLSTPVDTPTGMRSDGSESPRSSVCRYMGDMGTDEPLSRLSLFLAARPRTGWGGVALWRFYWCCFVLWGTRCSHEK